MRVKSMRKSIRVGWRVLGSETEGDPVFPKCSKQANANNTFNILI